MREFLSNLQVVSERVEHWELRERNSHINIELQTACATGGDIMEASSTVQLNGNCASQPALTASPLLSSAKPKLLDQVRQAIRTRHYSPRTEETYVGWIKRFIFFHDKRHPVEMAEPEIARFLSNLATESRVSGSTQHQALNALLFLYHQVLGKRSAM